MPVTRDCPTDELVGCPCTGVTLEKLIQPAVLTVLAEGAMHGYGLAERISALPAFAGDKPDVSGVYRVLRIMEERGLVASAWDTSGSGPAKRSYHLTDQGRECLHRWIDTLDRHRRAIGKLLGAARRAAAKMERDTVPH